MEIEVNNNRISFHDFLMFQAQYDIKLKEKDKEIERLKDLIIALWHNDNARFLNKEQIDLLNNIVFGNDEDLGSDKE
jgi:hypothetical protein